jgi:o-succinylbenzoate---CoA ligase
VAFFLPMAFTIIIHKQAYSLQEFVAASFAEPYLMRAQEFLQNWQLDGSFTFYSSGTTAHPKPYLFRKNDLMLSAQNTLQALKLQSEQEHILLCLDVKFVGGAMMLARALILGCQVSLFEPTRNILGLLSKEHPYTFASFVPLQLQTLAENLPQFERIKTVLIGGTYISPELKARILLAKNRVFHTYGMTETLSNIALMQLGVDAGYWVIPPNKIRLNEWGQICIHTPLYPQEFISNDLGKWIDATHFEFLGRTDFVINTGGIKVHPEQVEKIIDEQELLPKDILYCIAKANHPLWQEEIALVSNTKIASIYLDKISDCFKKLGISYAKPQRIIYISEWPINENGKIRRGVINQIIENEKL